MIDYLEGPFIKLTPAYTVVLCGGVGYRCHITRKTYEDIKNQPEASLQIQSVWREGKGTELYAFSEEEERTIFNLLTDNVSGCGPKTALGVLNAVSVGNLKAAVVANTPEVLSAAKGVGAKTAERIVLELRGKIKISEVWEAQATSTNPAVEEATLALMSLGHSKANAEKAVKSAQNQIGAEATAQDLVKQGLLAS